MLGSCTGFCTLTDNEGKSSVHPCGAVLCRSRACVPEYNQEGEVFWNVAQTKVPSLKGPCLPLLLQLLLLVFY